jgi:hypothetical protein
MTAQLPSWPTTPPAHGCVVLREFADEDAHLAVELGDDPYIPSSAACPRSPPPTDPPEHPDTGQTGGSPRPSYHRAHR